MSTTSTITPLRSQGPFEAARQSLIDKLQALKAPRGFSIFPHPSEFSTVADHVREATRIFDEWLASIGHEIADNSTCRVDTDVFLTAFTDATDNARWECERASEALIEEHNDMLRSA